ncbi:uncharacterized protein N7483_008269 [Penicillium malachiteum]|uniref:uncharacterized protein n=1 Tax=Penicillium malachiteum TaxID=1324776 RepID=UPI00254771B8|nr:uncharacterized protein N7483_008269 [Penicillium malachiteum]KAJ5720335.1 hypothetical protein N7483_008269 [Penicillium malachiteum]
MDDDYVARVLTKEARDSSQKYSTEGLGAYMPKRPAGNAPKPNTRFLRHLIRETDSHNTALKRKEEREARERMRALKDQSKAASISTSHSSRRPDRSSTTRDSEQQRKQDREDRHRSYRRRDRSRSRTPSTDRESSQRHRNRDEKDRHRTKDDRDREDHTERRRDRRRHESSRKDRRDRERSYSRSRSRSPRRGRDRDRDRAHRSHRSERSRRSESPPARSSHPRTKRESEPRSRRDEHTSSRQSRLSPQQTTKLNTSKTSSSATLRNDESDETGRTSPVTDHSTAPVRSRGRGAYKPSTSTIDAHFAPDYDPTLDVQPDEEHDGYGTKSSSRRHVPGLMTGEDDWDIALEALRDRTRWKQKGEERLRAAGINEDAINRWKTDAISTSQNDERRPEDVKWSTKDQGREWDRGKFVNDDGHIDVRAAWSK